MSPSCSQKLTKLTRTFGIRGKQKYRDEIFSIFILMPVTSVGGDLLEGGNLFDFSCSALTFIEM